MGRELSSLIWQLPFYNVEALLTYLEEKEGGNTYRLYEVPPPL